MKIKKLIDKLTKLKKKYGDNIEVIIEGYESGYDDFKIRTKKLMFLPGNPGCNGQYNDREFFVYSHAEEKYIVLDRYISPKNTKISKPRDWETAFKESMEKINNN